MKTYSGFKFTIVLFFFVVFLFASVRLYVLHGADQVVRDYVIQYWKSGWQVWLTALVLAISMWTILWSQALEHFYYTKFRRFLRDPHKRMNRLSLLLAACSLPLFFYVTPFLNLYSPGWWKYVLEGGPLLLSILGYLSVFSSEMNRDTMPRLSQFKYPKAYFDISSQAPASPNLRDEIADSLDYVRGGKSSRGTLLYMTAGSDRTSWPGLETFFRNLSTLFGGVPKERITLHDSTTRALDFAFSECLENLSKKAPRRAPVIVTTDSEYPDVRRRLLGRYESNSKAVVHEAPIGDALWERERGDEITSRICDLISKKKPDVVLLSHVIYWCGMGIYLTQVTTRCRIGEMEDYPRNLAEFEARFATEQACREYLCQLRWPEGFRCPRCGHDKAWAVRTALLECAGCGHQASPTAGTIFQDTRQPLQSWFRAMWWLTSQKNGASALGLQRALGLGSYKTAWTWLHKLRRAMVRPGRDRLSGRVEVDETYLGGLEEGVRGRQTDAKALIVVAAEEDGAGIGRVRIRTIPNASGDSLMAFVGESIEPGSVVHTDGWLGYEPLEGDGYRHEVSYLEGQPARASKLLPRVHRVVSLVKRWILGTHQGAVSHEHLDSYLDEFAFRFNRRKSRSRGKLFYRLVQQAVAVPPAPYKSLVGGTATRATDDHNM